jgi:hypothetical protein
MIKPFTFEADERTFSCRVEPPRPGRAYAWWWFSVTGDAQRYAPFQVATDDTLESVTGKVLSYYRALLLRRSQPVDAHSALQRRQENLAALKRVT